MPQMNRTKYLLLFLYVYLLYLHFKEWLQMSDCLGFVKMIYESRRFIVAVLTFMRSGGEQWRATTVKALMII